MRTVYLAGPIMGCDRGEANDWRIECAARLAEHGIRGVSPLRCEPLVGDTYQMEYADPKFGTARAISSKNLFDVYHCDAGIYRVPPQELGIRFDDTGIPEPYVKKPWSVGTLQELAWAKIWNKPAILVTTDPYLLEHPVVNASAGWAVQTLEEAEEIIVGLLGGYMPGGKNV